MIFTSVDVTAFAADFNNSASDFQMYQSNCLKSMKITVSPQGSYATAYGRIAIYTKETGYSWDNKYKPDRYHNVAGGTSEFHSGGFKKRWNDRMG